MVFPGAGIVRHSRDTVKRAKVAAERNSKNLQSIEHSWKTVEPDNPAVKYVTQHLTDYNVHATQITNLFH